MKNYKFHLPLRTASNTSWASTYDDVAVYPCSIIAARYQGVYEDGRWLAFPLEVCEVPEDVLGDDIECMSWFSNNKEFPIGRGTSPDEAMADLLVRLEPFLDKQHV